MNEQEQLEHAIAALEAQRSLLGDSVVDAALASMRQRLAILRSPPLAEQRKTVTILFADLVDFTAMSEQLDPEDVREIVNAYFTRCTEAIEMYGGNIEKFIGDAVMAVFGLVEAREDDPENAVRAALNIRQALSELNQEVQARWEMRLRMRIGIHTGPVVVSLLSERKGMDFVVVGDAVNLASRLQSVAPADGILISHSTYRHVRGNFNVQVIEPIRIKGKSESIQAYVILEAKSRPFRLETRGVEGIETRMVGREAEFQLLSDALDQMVRQGQNRIVTLVGEAGVGKSRLIYEFINWLELLPENFTFFKGRAGPAMQNAVFSLLRDLFSFRFQIQDSDPPQVVQEKMERGIYWAYETLPKLEQGGDHPAKQLSIQEIQKRAHFIGHLVGFDFLDSPYLRVDKHDARYLRDRAMVYLADYYRTLAVYRPIVIVLEDLQWADDNSLDVFSRMTNILPQSGFSHGVLVLCAARPDFFTRLPGWDEIQPLNVRIDLQSLDRVKCIELVDEILQKIPRVPAELRELVIANTDGNPLYIEEFIKMLIEDQVIVKADEEWQIDLARLTSIHIPPTLTGILQARLDSLPVGERLVLHRASVIGRVFWDAAVEYLAENERSEDMPISAPTAGLLDRLRSREMVDQRKESVFEKTREYLFRHALFRDVAYESVLKRQRSLYHAHAARWLEAVTQRSGRADEFSLLIADHYDRANEAQPAAKWYYQAGLQAAEHFANREAIRYFNRCLELLADGSPEDRFPAILAREKVFELLGERQLQHEDLESLTRLVDEMTPGKETDTRRVQVLLRLSRFSEATSDNVASIEYARRALKYAQIVGLDESMASCYLLWGSALWRQGKYVEARQPLEKALEIARRVSIPNLEADILRNLGIVNAVLSNYTEARLYYEQSLAIKRELGDLRGESATLNSLSMLVYDLGDYLQARQYLEQSLNIKREIGDRRGEEIAMNNLGLVAYSEGDPVAARRYMGEALSMSQEILDLEGQTTALAVLGLIATYQGDYAAAQDYLENSLNLFREQVNDVQGESEALSYMALLQNRLGNQEVAQEYATRALELARDVGAWREQFNALLFLGHALLALYRTEEAIQAYQQALDLPDKERQTSPHLEAVAGLGRAWLEKWQVNSGISAGMANDALEQARNCVEIILDHLATKPLQDVHEPARIYLTCYNVLHASRDARASWVLEQAYHWLNDRASTFQDEALKHLFLDNIPANRIICAEWATAHQLEDKP